MSGGRGGWPDQVRHGNSRIPGSGDGATGQPDGLAQRRPAYCTSRLSCGALVVAARPCQAGAPAQSPATGAPAAPQEPPCFT